MRFSAAFVSAAAAFLLAGEASAYNPDHHGDVRYGASAGWSRHHSKVWAPKPQVAATASATASADTLLATPPATKAGSNETAPGPAEAVAPAPPSSQAAATSTSTSSSVAAAATPVTPPPAVVAPAPAPAAVAASGSAAKRGLGFNDVSATTPFGNTCSWAYNWDSSYAGSLNSGVEYVPMLWGTTSDHTSSWTAHADAAIASGSKYLLGFNEPDLSSQSNLTPAQAAAAWKQYMEPYAGKATLISPAITNGAPPSMGTGWLDSFLDACLGCNIGGIAIHIYDSASNVAYYKSYISGIGTKYGKPVWVTEFGASGSVADQQTFLTTMIPFLDGLASVQRFSYFGDFAGTFVNGNALTPLGQTYASA